MLLWEMKKHDILLGDINVYQQFDKVRRMIATVPQFSLQKIVFI